MNINNLNYRPPISYSEPNKQESRTMTRAKAAKICQSIIFILDKEDYSEEVEEALLMAIEALQQQSPCDICENEKEDCWEMCQFCPAEPKVGDRE